MGPEFLAFDADNVEVLAGATVTAIHTSTDGKRFKEMEVSTLDGMRSTVTGKICVLAAGGIENPRLLLVSNLGNRHDLVGRCLMDHPAARVGYFSRKAARAIIDRFGFYGISLGGRTHMYMHGLSPSPELQAKERLLNSAVYMLEDRANDDPWDAMKRLMRGKSEETLSDLLVIAKSPGLIIKGGSMKLFQSKVTPEIVRRRIIDFVMRWNSNFVVREFGSRGLPHKLKGVFLDAISEHAPDRESRVMLSDRVDALGVPMAKVNWRIGNDARRTLMRLAELVAEEFQRVGLPAPDLAPWVTEHRPQDAVIIDMAHTSGTTRMSANPRQGVVDVDCEVHGVENLFVAGGSVFPTSGHANPTLMMVALAIRLADTLKVRLSNEGNLAMTATNIGPKVLVTGATGLIGRRVMAALLDRGYQVRAVYNRAPGSRADVEWVRANFVKPQNFASLVDGCTGVIHLAAELGDPYNMERLNVDVSRELATAAAAAGVKYFGHASSIVVYGSPKERVVDETTPLIDPARPILLQYIADDHMREYARTKALSEMAVAAAAGPMRVDIYRPSVVADAARLLESVSWGKLTRLLRATQNTNYVPVGDCAEAMAHLLQRGLAPDDRPDVEAFNLADDGAPTFKALLGGAYARYGDARYKVGASLPGVFSLLKAAKFGHAFSGRRGLGDLKFSARKLTATGFTPKTGVRHAIDEAMEAAHSR